MKEKVISNWGLKLISVIFAIILWLIVVNVDDPVTTKKFKNIPVNILSEQLISEAGEVYEVLDESDRVTVTVKAKRSLVESLSLQDFKVTADFAERISENSIPIQVQVTKRQSEIVDMYLDNNTVKIAVEAKEVKDVPVVLSVNGKTADGYTVGQTEVEPKMVTIAGPASDIGKVSKVTVPVDVNGASEDIDVIAAGTLCSENGTVVTSDRIEGDVSQIAVRVHLLHTKSIDLNITTQGEPAADYRCQDIQYKPTTITIAGEPEDLEAINTLTIPPEVLDISGAMENVVKEIDVTQYLPANLIVCNEAEKKVLVTAVISELDGREFRIPVDQVDILNTPVGIDAFLDDARAVSVIVKGDSNELNSLSESDIKVSVDIKDKSLGTHNLQADVAVPNGYVVMNKPMVSVTLKVSEDNSSTPTPNENDLPTRPPNADIGITSTPSGTPPPTNTPSPTPSPSPIPSEGADTEIPPGNLEDGS